MFRAKIFNLENKMTNRADFETQQEMISWIDAQNAKERPFGIYYQTREKIKSNCSKYELTLVIEEFEVDIETGYRFDGEEEIVTTNTITKVTLKKDYIISMEDLFLNEAYMTDARIRARIDKGHKSNEKAIKFEMYLSGLASESSDEETDELYATMSDVMEASNKNNLKKMRKLINKISAKGLVSEQVLSDIKDKILGE
ncbi:MAG: hypothetical protein DRN30_03725 [Thermoplasmata archaeon]|nr:MAG: hypothetical protein DRN30_03725 [Thermoplasmata archaeon]